MFNKESHFKHIFKKQRKEKKTEDYIGCHKTTRYFNSFVERIRYFCHDLKEFYTAEVHGRVKIINFHF